MAEKVTTEDRGAVRILTINRPDQRNCVDGETAVGIGRAIEAFAADERARVLVVTGAGDLAFCAGADLLLGRDTSRAPTIRRRRARRLAASAGAVAELRTNGTEGNQRWKRRDRCSTTRR